LHISESLGLSHLYLVLVVENFESLAIFDNLRTLFEL